MSFHLICEFFLIENEKVFKVGKIRKDDYEKSVLEKHLHQKGKAQSMPAVAGRLVM